MPATPRVSLTDTAYYHCVSHCVRNAFLCDENNQVGNNDDYRRKWVEDYLLKAGSAFSIDICAYAIMSNHLHIVIHINKQQANAWSMDEVLTHWLILHKGTPLTRLYQDSQQRVKLDKKQLKLATETIESYRQQLCDLSCFMSNISQYIACKANKEDQCTGRFWEGRLKTQALLDKAALIACMAYVDLNPICVTPPESWKHTSLNQRIEAVNSANNLFTFAGDNCAAITPGLPFQVNDYLELIDITGEMIKTGRRDSINIKENAIIQRIGIPEEQWLTLVCKFKKHFPSAVGKENLLRQYYRNIGKKQASGVTSSRRFFNTIENNLGVVTK